MSDDWEHADDNSKKCFNLAIDTLRERLEKSRVVIGNCALYNEDCQFILPILHNIDAVITDPPYGISRDAGMGGGGTDASGKYKRRSRVYVGGWDDERVSREIFDILLTKSTWQVIWGGNFYTDFLPVGGKWLVWDKLNSMPSYSDCELAWTNLSGSSVKKFTQCSSGNAANRDGRVHPTQKPILLMKWCIDHLPNCAQTILDPFMGSGTTAVAAISKGKTFIGIERERKYFDIACRRIEDGYKQGDMFIAPPTAKPEQTSLLEI